MKKLDLYWKSKKEWRILQDNGTYIVNPDAPKEAQDSYKHYLEQIKRDIS